LHDGNLSGPPRPEVCLQRSRAGDEEEPGNGLADDRDEVTKTPALEQRQPRKHEDTKDHPDLLRALRGFVVAFRPLSHARFGILRLNSGGRMRRSFMSGGLVLAMLIAAGAGRVAAQRGAAAAAPKFEVEPLWPKPFPVAKHWILGSVTGVAIDAQ